MAALRMLSFSRTLSRSAPVLPRKYSTSAASTAVTGHSDQSQLPLLLLPPFVPSFPPPIDHVDYLEKLQHLSKLENWEEYQRREEELYREAVALETDDEVDNLDHIIGVDYKHWSVSIKRLPDGTPRDTTIEYMVNTLATVVGSVDEAKKLIYSVCTHPKLGIKFGALLSDPDLRRKLQDSPNVTSVSPDWYEDLSSKKYPGEPFINGQVVPYHPKYYLLQTCKERVYSKRYCNCVSPLSKKRAFRKPE